MKNLGIVTSTRADYGILKSLIKYLIDSKSVNLKIFTTGTHLSYEFGYTINEIINDGFEKNIIKVEIQTSSISNVGVVKTMGLATLSFAEVFSVNKVDLLVVLGDRYEIFSIASVAATLGIPIAHLHGGETTQGALDEFYRHCITKMSYLHFTATEDYKNRVIQLGEQPNSVYNFGSLGVEAINNLELLNKQELENSLQIKLSNKLFLVTYHPTTLDPTNISIKLNFLLEALDEFKDFQIIFTKANADEGGSIINNYLENIIKIKSNWFLFSSLGQLRYFSLLKYTSCVIGNSSSGIIEVPSFGIPTVNIGDRQKGRIMADSVIICDENLDDIRNAIQFSLSTIHIEKCKKIINPYYKPNTTCNIAETLLKFSKTNKVKVFYDTIN